MGDQDSNLKTIHTIHQYTPVSFNKEIQLEEQKRRYVFLYSLLSEMRLKIPITKTDRISFNKETQTQKKERKQGYVFSDVYTTNTSKEKENDYTIRKILV